MTQPTPEVRKTEQYLIGPPTYDVQRVTDIIDMATSVHGTPVLYSTPADAIDAHIQQNRGQPPKAETRIFKVTIEQIGTVL